jgi:protoporphyrinogen/coproporphyrinogen III oxidase
MPDVIVAGAGISGLTCAYALKKSGKDVLIIEGSPRPGGKIGTDRIEGYLLEAGPNSLRLENRETLDLLRDLNVSDRLLEASPNAKKRFILRDGEWVQVPRAPFEAIGTKLFSFSGKLRALREVMVKSSSDDDESIAKFFTRHFGKEVFEYAADPFVTGIYAGDPNKLSVRHSFAQLWRLDQKFGSLIRGGIKQRRQPKNPDRVKPRIVSFPEGLGELIAKLRQELQNELLSDEEAISLERSNEQFSLTTNKQKLFASNIILAAPAYTVAPFVASLDPELATLLTEVDYPPVGVAYLGYRTEQFSKPIEGFGGLIPTKEHRKILGIIYSSSNFPGRAPEGHTLLTVLMGGARNRAVGALGEEEIADIAQAEVQELLSPTGAPTFQRARLWKHAIPQYNIGYDKILTALDKTERQIPGLHFIGNYRGGISIGACIQHATELARRLVAGG